MVQNRSVRKYPAHQEARVDNWPGNDASEERKSCHIRPSDGGRPRGMDVVDVIVTRDEADNIMIMTCVMTDACHKQNESPRHHVLSLPILAIH